jgi:ferric-dicitrate binding protein FerR (iron transport regulator)
MSDRPARASDLMKRLPRLGAAIDPGLTDRDVERLIAGARRRRRRRTVTHALLGAAAAAGAAAIVAVRLAGPAA